MLKIIQILSGLYDSATIAVIGQSVKYWIKEILVALVALTITLIVKMLIQKLVSVFIQL